MLFIIFINDIDDAAPLLNVLSKFADDTKAVRIIANETDQELMQKDINALVDWSDTWQMTFNADKCKVVHVGKHNPVHFYTMIGHAPGGVVLSSSDVEKDRCPRALKS